MPFAQSRGPGTWLRLGLASAALVPLGPGLGRGAAAAKAPCAVVHADGTFEVIGNDSSAERFCSRLIMANCSRLEDRVGLCPSVCPFLERSSYSQCGAACVAAEECGSYRAGYPFPNKDTGLCEPCPGMGCAACEPERGAADVLRCTRCRHGFTLSPITAQCIYNADFVLGGVYTVLTLLFLGLVAAAVTLFVMCNRNAEALTRGIEHRNRCLPHQVETSPCTSKHASEAEVIFHSRSPLYPLTVNVHNQNIVGVGLALYYNHLVFVALVAGASWAILKYGEEFLGLYRWSVLECGYGSQDDVETVMVAYSRRRGVMALFLWAALLPASIVFARFQASAERTFGRRHTRMQDYTLSVHGLPPTATRPGEVKQWAERLLGTDIEGVSIGYKYQDHQQQVAKLLDEHLAQRDVAFQAALGVPTAASFMRSRAASEANGGRLSVVPEETSERLPERGESDSTNAAGTTQGLLPADWLSNIESSGEAFIVMRYEEDVERLFALWDDRPNLQRMGSFLSTIQTSRNREGSSSSNTSPSGEDPRLFRGHAVELREVTSEPTSVVWEHVGVPEPVLLKRAAVAIVVFLAAASAFNYALFVPYFNYVQEYSRKAGQAPTPLQTFGLGVIVSAGNTLISNIIWVGVPRLGFQRKDQADIVTFVVRWVCLLLNTLGLVILTALKLSMVGASEHGMISGADAALARSVELGREAALAHNIFVLFLTGIFSVSYVCFWCTYPLTYWQSVALIRTGVLGSDLSTRTCESLMAPMEIWLPWDYASHIQLTCCAFVPLFLAEPPGDCASRKLCAVLLLWCAVMYCAQRVIHLRFSKETFFSTARLDKAVLAAWGMPVSQLAMAAAYWGTRALEAPVPVKVVACIVTFAASCALYWKLLYWALQHNTNITRLYSKKSESYKAAQARLRYTYFNTNPVHVLLSEHVPHLGLERATYYEAGKAYLQASDPRAQARLEAARSAAEAAPDAHHGPRSKTLQMMYRAQVWLTGAPKQAFQSLDGVEENSPMHPRW